MDKTLVLKALGDETRMKLLTLLLKHNYCVRALARKLELSEAAISQHLKVLREAGLLIGEKRGYFMHYDVERAILHELAGELEALAAIERELCTPEMGRCHPSEQANCHVKGKCSDETKEFCHGKHHDGHHGGHHNGHHDGHHGEGHGHHEHCKCHKS